MANPNCNKCENVEVCRWLHDLEGVASRYNPEGHVPAEVIPNVHTVRSYLPNLCKHYKEVS